MQNIFYIMSINEESCCVLLMFYLIYHMIIEVRPGIEVLILLSDVGKL